MNVSSSPAPAVERRLEGPLIRTAGRLPCLSPKSVAAWILSCAFCNAIGWILSALHQLNIVGYTVAFVGAVAFILVVRKRLGWSGWREATVRILRKQRFRFGKLFPLLFMAVAGLGMIGGAIHPPSNYDALAYRTPRVLHWLAAGQWHWIHTEFQRLNTRGCGMEWVTAPLIVFTRTDRFFFLINATCFLLLPGRVFSVLRGFGVSSRVAWYWMWLLPTGYCYLLQAGSIGNDLFGAFFALAAFEFALRARANGRVSDLWLSLLAAGLMTAGKAFNILLLLPWAIAVWSALPLLLRYPIQSILMILFSASASLLPMACLNQWHCGDWTGLKAESVVNVGMRAPIFRVAVNGVLILLHNFAPTIFPAANHWNALMERAIPAGLSVRLHENFEPDGAGLRLGEMQMEEAAGLGFGISLLLVFTLIATVPRTLATKTTPARAFNSINLINSLRLLVPIATLAALLIFMAQSGLSCPARYLAPFYVLLVAPLLRLGSESIRLLRKPWWQGSAVGVFFLAAVLLIVSPARPLWPAVTCLRAAGAEHSPHPLIRRAWTVYSVYGQRADAFAPAREILSADANPLGVITADDPETSLWRPFGSRRIVHVCVGDNPEELRKKGIKYVLINSGFLAQHFQLSLQQWLAQNNGQLLRHLPLELRASSGPSEWFLIELR